MQEIKVGTYTGAINSAALGKQSVILGFTPDHVRITSTSEIWNWFTGMSSGAAIGTVGAPGSLVAISAEGIHVLTDAMNPTGYGFAVGSSVNKVNTAYYYVAMRNG